MYFSSNQRPIILPEEQWQNELVGEIKSHKYGEDLYGVECLDKSYVKLARQSKRDIVSAFTAEIVVEERSNNQQKRRYWGREQPRIAAPIIFETGKIGFRIDMGNPGSDNKAWTVDDIEPPRGTDVFKGLHHYALSYDIDNGARLYVDGVLAATKMPPDDLKYVASQPGNEDVIWVGKKLATGAVIYSVRMSTTAKSAEEIKRSACKLLVYFSMEIFSVAHLGQFHISF